MNLQDIKEAQERHLREWKESLQELKERQEEWKEEFLSQIYGAEEN